MTVTLFDKANDDHVFDINFWNWRAIVEAVRGLGVLPEERVDDLHEIYAGDLTETEAHRVAEAVRLKLLPSLKREERLLLDGSRTSYPDDLVFYRHPDETHHNYSTNREVLARFAEFCGACKGFKVC